MCTGRRVYGVIRSVLNYTPARRRVELESEGLPARRPSSFTAQFGCADLEHAPGNTLRSASASGSHRERVRFMFRIAFVLSALNRTSSTLDTALSALEGAAQPQSSGQYRGRYIVPGANQLRPPNGIGPGRQRSTQRLQDLRVRAHPRVYTSR